MSNLKLKRQVAAWLRSGDTGVSSETLVAALMGDGIEDTDVPRDAEDFGRCQRVLRAIPAFGPRLGEVCRRFPAWTPLVREWTSLSSTYEVSLNSGDFAAFNKVLDAVLKEVDEQYPSPSIEDPAFGRHYGHDHDEGHFPEKLTFDVVHP
ncbi:hypothetical protein [Burkholderia sp. MBR-1]|uniref:hypothetical protein n=1 Tax=Burkholderia sp. MBR-1 TaxID=2732364 RepID=UPI0015EEC499|nr:hypothetical protein [Burkholderia sp. MBR-1]QMI49725.1 hypothetical protein MBR110_30080 [Burkholderia sp. MBR-1]